MSTALAATLAILPSLPLLLWMALRDPKRLRSRRLATPPMTPRWRGAVVTLLLLPGLGLMGLGQWPAFLIWLGAVLSFGWLLVQILGGESFAGRGG